MANIDPNEHGVAREFLGELKVEEISSKLGIDLSEHIAGY